MSLWFGPCSFSCSCSLFSQSVLVWTPNWKIWEYQRRRTNMCIWSVLDSHSFQFLICILFDFQFGIPFQVISVACASHEKELISSFLHRPPRLSFWTKKLSRETRSSRSNSKRIQSFISPWIAHRNTNPQFSNEHCHMTGKFNRYGKCI